ncbi:zinc-binding alcohol dehydrogenase family protein [Pseudidiomarina aestuarii]|uniref:Zinc-type alcohol dehydrogenase-like protein n=1 Tax=Pseudidiomarina aestuarii TaxID=624146 RepID=A0A7Z7ETN9_9GAMM|nr:zinc-binding alcohol dehydrogenase family protein [Pseudidiomarina aestuarii]RUO41019.1 zinc-binding alcohol dehydrogenase family protein [Pseudidiomarina aestuarii]
MRAVGYQQSLPYTDKLALQDIEISRPICGDHDVLVRVRGIGLNPVDTKIRQRKEAAAGEYVVLGWDAAGTIVDCGSQVTNFKVGDEVWYAGAVNRDGCNAEYQSVDSRLISARPTTLSAADAAAMPLTFLTAWELLFDRLQLDKDAPNVLLITGAAGGVGSALIQLTKALTRTTVIATASRAETKQWVKQLGADIIINHHQTLAPQLKEYDINDVTHVASLTHTEQHFEQLVELLEPQGRLALIDDPKDPLPIGLMKQKSLSLHWEFMFTRSLFTTKDISKQGEILAQVANLVDTGAIQTTRFQHLGTISAETLRQAHGTLEAHQAIGKLVVDGYPD